MSILGCILDLHYSVKNYSIRIKFYYYVHIYSYRPFHAGRDFNDTVTVTEVPVAQTLLVQAIQIFDDEINEGREIFNVSLQVVSNISNAVEYRIQTTLCRIRQSDRKLSCKICIYRITGNFGGGFNLAIWRLKSLSPNFKFANNM